MMIKMLAHAMLNPTAPTLLRIRTRTPFASDCMNLCRASARRRPLMVPVRVSYSIPYICRIWNAMRDMTRRTTRAGCTYFEEGVETRGKRDIDDDFVWLAVSIARIRLGVGIGGKIVRRAFFIGRRFITRGVRAGRLRTRWILHGHADEWRAGVLLQMVLQYGDKCGDLGRGYGLPLLT